MKNKVIVIPIDIPYFKNNQDMVSHLFSLLMHHNANPICS